MLGPLFTTQARQEERSLSILFEGIQCQKKGSDEKCIVLSISTDQFGKKFEYEWDLGDGTFKKGSKIEHCYQSYKSYKVSLNLIDPVSGFKIDEELSEIIHISKNEDLSIHTNRELTKNTKVNFTYTSSDDSLRITQVYWTIGADFFSDESSPEYMIKSDEEVEVKLLVEGFRNGLPIKKCITELFNVTEFIIDGAILNDIFSKKELTLTDQSRFLDDEAHYIFYEKNQPSNYQLFDIKINKYHVEIEPEKIYEMYAWKGNIFTQTQEVNTIGLTQEQSKDALKRSAKELFDKELVHISGFRFEQDSNQPPSMKIAEIADILNTYEHVNISIGTYTHTGGRLDRNIELARSRGEEVKKALIKMGIKPERLTVLTASDEHDLLNTCYGFIECDLENKELNRKTDFRVEGIISN